METNGHILPNTSTKRQNNEAQSIEKSVEGKRDHGFLSGSTNRTLPAENPAEY